MSRFAAVVALLLVQLILTAVPAAALAQPTVTLTLDDGMMAEADLDPGRFTVTRTDDGNTAQNLDVRVQLDLDSTATINVDYTASPFTFVQVPNIYQITILPNQLSQMVTVTPILDANQEEGSETIETTLQGDGSTYTAGPMDHVVITIADFVDAMFKDSFENLSP